MSDDFFLLPEALMMDIWLRLSIKSTVRFRCVSKPWCASLSDPHFIYKNLTLSSAANDHLLLINQQRPHYSVISHETLLATPLQVPPEVADPHPDYTPDVLTPPLDDMVCFYHRGEHDIGVLNLSTGETKVIPRLEYDDGYTSSITLGFGFDEKRKEYKIVHILLTYQKEHFYKMKNYSFVAYVYSLSSSSSSNSWREVGEPNMLYNEDYGPVTVYSQSYGDGTFYWGSGELILSFDMSTEVFNYISIPFLDVYSGMEVIWKLKDGSMLMITINCRSNLREYEIWALFELGVTQAWTKLSVIDLDWKKGAPFGFWRNEVVIKSHSNGGLTILDPFKREIKEIQTDGPVDIRRCLVWTKGGKKASSSLLSGLQGEEEVE